MIYLDSLKVPRRAKDNDDVPDEDNNPNPTVASQKTNKKVLVEATTTTSSVAKSPKLKLRESDTWEKTQMERTKERYILRRYNYIISNIILGLYSNRYILLLFLLHSR